MNLRSLSLRISPDIRLKLNERQNFINITKICFMEKGKNFDGQEFSPLNFHGQEMNWLKQIDQRISYYLWERLRLKLNRRLI